MLQPNGTGVTTGMEDRRHRCFVQINVFVGGLEMSWAAGKVNGAVDVDVNDSRGRKAVLPRSSAESPAGALGNG